MTSPVTLAAMIDADLAHAADVQRAWEQYRLMGRPVCPHCRCEECRCDPPEDDYTEDDSVENVARRAWRDMGGC